LEVNVPTNPFGQTDLPQWVDFGNQQSQGVNISPMVDALKKRKSQPAASGPFQPEAAPSFSDMLGGSVGKPSGMKPESF